MKEDEVATTTPTEAPKQVDTTASTPVETPKTTTQA
jgi:hypothetical protein